MKGVSKMNFLNKSKDGIYAIRTKSVKELQNVWENRKDDNVVLFLLAKEIVATGGKKSEFSSIKLLGRNLDKRYSCVHEGIIGELTAVDKGIVFFNPVMKSDGIGGFLERNISMPGFALWSIKKTYFHGHLYIRENDNSDSNVKYPYEILYNPDHGQFINLFITSNRWKEMEEWLNEWLPKSE